MTTAAPQLDALSALEALEGAVDRLLGADLGAPGDVALLEVARRSGGAAAAVGGGGCAGGG